jgi:dGTPase
MNRALRKFLYANVYYHPRVAEVNRRACEMLKAVFESYVADSTQLGDAATKRIEHEGLHRTICDYVAGMTDRYLIEEYARISGDRAVFEKMREPTGSQAAARPVSSSKY